MIELILAFIFVLIILYIYISNAKYTNVKKLEENLYIQKTKFGDYRVVYPVVKDIEKPFSLNNINWKNLIIGGKWSNVLTLIVIIGLVMFSAWAYQKDHETCQDHLVNPCKYCAKVDYSGMHTYDTIPDINFSDLKIGDANEGIIQGTP